MLSDWAHPASRLCWRLSGLAGVVAAQTDAETIVSWRSFHGRDRQISNSFQTYSFQTPAGCLFPTLVPLKALLRPEPHLMWSPMSIVLLGLRRSVMSFVPVEASGSSKSSRLARFFVPTKTRTVGNRLDRQTDAALALVVMPMSSLPKNPLNDADLSPGPVHAHPECIVRFGPWQMGL